MLDAGVPLAIGTDDMTIGDDDDLLGEVRLVRAIARSQGGSVSAAEVLAMATAGGARALGWESMIGTLEPGKRADLVLLDLSRILEPDVASDASMLELVVSRARGGDVHTVLVDGDVVVDAGRHVAVDRDDVRRRLAVVVRAQDADVARASFAAAMRSIADARARWALGQR
jgi:5-methylthioadenosine/S-adenosylhomocysteine deaminase